MRREIESLYWIAQEAAEDSPGLRESADLLFRRERALSAAIAAFELDPFDAACRAVYESLFAVSNRLPLRALILSVRGEHA